MYCAGYVPLGNSVVATLVAVHVLTLEMENQRWSSVKNIQFIKEYQQKECLWDPLHPQYKNRAAREAAYTAIMEVMGMASVRDVIRKLRTLRNTYNNEALKAKKCLSTNKLYISKIPWLSHLDFLKNIDNFTNGDITNNMSSNIDITSNKPEGNRSKIRDPFLKAVDALQKVSTQHISNANNDEFDLFGQTIAEQLRHLPLPVALETEEMILYTVRKQRIRVAKKLSSAQRERSSSPEFNATRTIDAGKESVLKRASSSESDDTTSGQWF